MGSLYVNCISWAVDDGCPEGSVKVQCPTKNEIEDFDKAVMMGDIVWAHSPFNINPELVGDSYLFEDMVQVVRYVSFFTNSTVVSTALINRRTHWTNDMD